MDKSKQQVFRPRGASRQPEFQRRYEGWWLNKLVKVRPTDEPKRVVKVELVGPPSFIYGNVWLHFEDGSSQAVFTTSYRPIRRDVLVIEENTDGQITETTQG